MGPSRTTANTQVRPKRKKSKKAPKSVIRRFIVTSLDADIQSYAAPSSVKRNRRTSCSACRSRKQKCELEAGTDGQCKYCYDNQVECYRDDFFEEETIRPETWAARKLYVPEVEHAPRGGEYPGIHLLEETTPSPVTLHGSSIETGATQEPSSTSVPTSFEVFQPSRTSFPSVALDAFRGDELLAEILETISEPSHFNPPFPTGNDVHNDVAGLSLFRAVTSQGPAGMQPPSMNGVFPHLGMGEYVAGEAYDTAPDFLSEWMNTSAMSAGNWA